MDRGVRARQRADPDTQRDHARDPSVSGLDAGEPLSKIAQSFRWGRLIGSLEAARDALVIVRTCTDLLPESDRKLLTHASEILAGIEQRAWNLKTK